MTLAAVIIAATLWHWSPPTTGSPVALYSGEVRDAWGAVVTLFSTPDTTWAPPLWLDHIAHRVAVRPVDAGMRAGTPSAWSDQFIPREWIALWWGMGARCRVAPLSMTIAGVQELEGVDSLE